MTAAHLPTQRLDTLGQALGKAALTLLVQLYPEVRQANEAQRQAACAAMRAKSKAVIDALIDDAKSAPWMAHLALQTAALALAHAGIQALKGAMPSLTEAKQNA